jgi:hypothetical protein
MNFRDMTFCEHWRDCALAAKCRRPLTDDVILAARKWWGGEGAPISIFVDKPGCHQPANAGKEPTP